MKQRFIKLATIFLLLLTGFACLPVKADVALDKIVAIVNDSVITQSQLNAQMGGLRQQAQQMHMALPAANVLRNQVLQHLIDEQLQIDLAKKLGVKVSAADLDRGLAQIAQQNNLSVNDLQSKVVQQGMNYDQYRQQISKQI
jgi:peptidyl-prolyl cis-trans isomerase SurA